MIFFHEPNINKNFLTNLSKLLKVKKGLNYSIFQKKLKNLIKKKFKFKNVLLTNSCTSSLEIVGLIIKNSKKKGNIVMSSYNYPTTASAFIRAGLNIKFIDIEGNSLMSSYDQYLKGIDKNTVAVLTTHYAGLNVHYLEKLKKLCTQKKIFLIEDSAQALDSYHNGKPLGSFGDFSSFSFHETKNVHSVTGGMLICKSKKMHKIAKFILDRGTDRAKVISGRKNKYEWVTLGSAFNMTDVQAAMLYDQILNLKTIKNQRKKLYNFYLKYFEIFELDKNFYFNKINESKNYHCIYIVLKNNIRKLMIDYLSKKKIQTYVGYSPLHNSKYYKNIKKNIYLNKTELLSKKVLRLPLHNFLKETQIKYICKNLQSFYKLHDKKLLRKF
tara:strand:- start:22 stop:1173 length:1152 start_codon:yes stop_codon:yes gene_type:complete